MPTVFQPDWAACCCAHSCNCGSDGDLYSSVRPCSAACRCGSPVPPNHTSVFGLSRSAMSCASASPEPFSDKFTRVPVVRAYTVEIMLHQSACTEQMTLIWPSARAAAERTTSAIAHKSVFMAFTWLPGGCELIDGQTGDASWKHHGRGTFATSADE